MTSSVSYKVKYNDGGETNIRRFCLDKDVSTSFTYLEEKLCHVFPELKRQGFTIQWTDEEGDIVTVGNDEDLMIAMTEMKGALYKFTVKVNNIGDNEAKTGGLHPGVMCDGCQGKVVGFRYKCLVCEDFDLCTNCEYVGCHPQHNMIRINNPDVFWPQQVFSPLRVLNQTKETSEKEKLKKKQQEENQCKSVEMFAPSVDALLGPTFEMVVNAMTGFQKKTDKVEDNAKKESKDGDGHLENSTLEKSFEQLSKYIIDNSKNIEKMGKAVSDLLEPLGVDVNVQFMPKVDSEKENENNETEHVNIKPVQEKTVSEENNLEPEKEKYPENQTSVVSGDGEWNIIENCGDNKDDTRNVELPNAPHGTAHDSKIPEDIVSAPSTSAPTDASMIAVHPDPKVKVALQAMLNMGFNNDGGWLTNLLETKQGDIGKTLDVLNPKKI